MHVARHQLVSPVDTRSLPLYQPVRVVAVTSGKGGVGKTSISVNLAVALASAGAKVLLLDADLGLGNVDVMLNLRADRNLSHVLDGVCSLEQIIVDGPAGLGVVPASSGMRRMTDLSPSENAGLIRAFSDLERPVDTLVIDTAAGISDSVVSFTRAAREVVVVVCDEPTAVSDALAQIRTLRCEQGIERLHLLANMVRDVRHGQALYARLLRSVDEELDVTLNYLGAVPFDRALQDAVRGQRPVVEHAPGSPSATAFRRLARVMEQWPLPLGPQGNLEFFIERLIRYSSTSGEAQ